MSPLFYVDVTDPGLNVIKENIEKYSEAQNINVFMLKYPKSDLDVPSENYDNCFVLLSPGYKIIICGIGENKGAFDNYCVEIEEIISYLYFNYNYRTYLGLYSQWKTKLFARYFTDQFPTDIADFFQTYALSDKWQKKVSELFSSLCTGSINDIKRVKADVPATLLDHVKQKIQSFDGDQPRFIYQELNKGLIKIQGLSGTGKTELLLHKIKELYQRSDEYRIFVTCHNKILADTLKNRIPDFFDFMKVTKQIEWNKRLWCANAWGHNLRPLSGLYSFICDSYGLEFYSFGTASFDSACKHAIEEIRLKHPDHIPPILDYVFIDECQDFKESFFELCSLVTSKQVFLAGDIFQSIFAENITRDYTADYFLTKCYRTDYKTLMFAHALGLGLFEDTPLRWLSKENWEACGYDCEVKEEDGKIVLKRDPVRRFVDIPSEYESVVIKQYQEGNFCEQICDCIHHILSENKTCTVDDICIILLDNTQNTYTIANQLENVIGKEFSWQVNKAYETKKRLPGTLLLSNRNNVKGLEFPFVICVTQSIKNNYVYRNALYTMLTRSFLQTIFMVQEGDNGITQNIMDGYREIMQKQKMTIRKPSDEQIAQIDTRFNEAKQHKPLKEVITEMVSELGLDAAKSKKIIDIALTMSWEDCSDEELKYKIQTLNQIW